MRPFAWLAAGFIAATAAATVFGWLSSGERTNATREELDELKVRMTELESSLAEMRREINASQSLPETLRKEADSVSNSLEFENSERTPGLRAHELLQEAEALQGRAAVAKSLTEFMTLDSEAREQRVFERLLEVGFNSQQVERLRERIETFRLEAIEKEFDNSVDAATVTSAARLKPMDYVHQRLRQDLGDIDYGKYRRAMNLSTNVPISDVLRRSPAESAGIAVGDAITAYNGQRVFDLFEVDEIARRQATPATVIVELVRDGATLQLVVPRGSLGVVAAPWMGALEELERAAPSP